MKNYVWNRAYLYIFNTTLKYVTTRSCRVFRFGRVCILDFLIKGAAGNGKTILALTLLKELNEKGVYITDQKRDVLQKLHPWIESLPVSFVDIKILGLKSTHVKGEVCVIDTIEALESVVSRQVLNELINNFRKVVLVSEGSDRRLDFLCDGIVHLKKRIIEGNYYRYLEIPKLRGIDIQNYHYPFTLHEGTFSVLKTKSVSLGEFEKVVEENCLSTGVADLDNLIGGLSGRDIFTIEFQPNVFKRHVYNFMKCLTFNSLANGRGVVIVPFPEVSGVSIKRRFKDAIVVELQGDLDYDLEMILNEMNSARKYSKPTTVEICLDSVYLNYAPEGNCIKFLSTIISNVLENEDLLVFNMGEDSPLRNIIAPVSAAHVKLISSDSGDVFIYGIKPKTRLHCVTYDDNKIRLIPVS